MDDHERMTRRNMLTALGAVGTAFASHAMLKGIPSVSAEGQSVMHHVYSVGSDCRPLCAVDSVEALRSLDSAHMPALPHAGADYVCTLGYYAAGDGGAAAYYCDAADTSPDNSGSVIVSADGRRWKLAVANNVKQFGAKGDGVADESAAFQRYADYITASDPYATFFIPDGRFRITGVVSFPCGMSMKSEGIIEAATQNLFRWEGGDPNIHTGTRIKDLRIECASVPTTAEGSTNAGLYFDTTALRGHIQLENIQILSKDGISRTWGFDHYIQIHNCHKLTIDGLHIDACGKWGKGNTIAGQYLQRGLKITGQAIQVTLKNFLIQSIYEGCQVTGSLAEGLRIREGDFVGVYHGITAENYNRPGFWIHNVHINAVKRGISITGSSNVDVAIDGAWIYRSGVFFTESAWTGIHLGGCVARTALSNISYSLSQFTADDYGLYLDNCLGVSGTNLSFGGTNKAIWHHGVNQNIQYDNVLFNGLGASGIAFTPAAGDVNVALGAHTFLGSVGTRYNIAVKKPTITIDRGRPRYPKVSAGNTISESSPETFATLNVLSSSQMLQANMAPGSTSYTKYVVLDKTNAFEGDFFELVFNVPAISGGNSCALGIRSGVGGTVLKTITSGATTKNHVIKAVFGPGTDWIIWSHSVNEP